MLIYITNPVLTELGMTCIRIGTGLLFIMHGYQKLMAGSTSWHWYGSQMSLIGITVAPLFWGLCAVAGELLGGLCLTVGFCTRLAATVIAFIMVIALIYHIKKGDAFTVYSHALSELIIMIGLIIAGSGHYSVDTLLWYTLKS